jgi:hypothetical protein
MIGGCVRGIKAPLLRPPGNLPALNYCWHVRRNAYNSLFDQFCDLEQLKSGHRIIILAHFVCSEWLESRTRNFNKQEVRSNTMEKEQGKVKWFNDAKGYGFIQRASVKCLRAPLGTSRTGSGPGRRRIGGIHRHQRPQGFQAENVTSCSSNGRLPDFTGEPYPHRSTSLHHDDQYIDST